MSETVLRLKGARVHNLKNVDLEVPKNSLVVFCGLSGSGKSSLAFDTIFAEGQRRYVESLSAYARQFLGRLDRPDVDFIEGLSPTVAIDQKTTSRNPRSTLGTVTEIFDYMRLLWARVGQAHCPKCGEPIVRQSVQQIVDALLALKPGTRYMLLAPVVNHKKGEFLDLFEKLAQEGFSRVLVDDQTHSLIEPIKLAKTRYHDIAVVVDRLVAEGDLAARLADSIEVALKLSSGRLEVHLGQEDGILRFNQNLACPNQHPLNLAEIEPRTFSFNSPLGACQNCSGIGVKMTLNEELVLGKPGLSLREGVIVPWSSPASGLYGYYESLLAALAQKLNFSLDVPWNDLPEEIRQTILFGQKQGVQVRLKSRKGRGWGYGSSFEGVIPGIERGWLEADSDRQRQRWAEYLQPTPCPECLGTRLRAEVLAVKVMGLDIASVTDLSLEECAKFFASLKLEGKEKLVAEPILREIVARLDFLLRVGLGYLCLSRQAATLSGGEAQRIRLATQIGSGLTGVLYVLDEPSIGLHQRDNQRLIETLLRLRDLGNTLIVVEHDEETIRTADWLVDVGPRAGVLGGEIVHSGKLNELLANPRSLTGAYLSGQKSIQTPSRRSIDLDQKLQIIGAKANNLDNIDVTLPLRVLVAITGVSGSGKSTLVHEILYKTLARELNGSRDLPGKHRQIKGLELIDKVVLVDQGPIGRTPRSNPATYTGVFDKIRTLFAQTPEAKARGYTPGRFSFNVKGGRCEACSGDGTLRIEMSFLPDVYVMCEVCKGSRYNRDTLQIRYRGLNIAEVLGTSILEAEKFFAPLPSIHNHLKLLLDVGLGYLTLGQPATTLSGGEAQRVKLASELIKRSTGKTVYVLDEPTTGLHFEDVKKLLEVLNRLVDKGNSVLVIEHNLDLIKTADWVIDLGPEGGSRGGRLIAEGAPEVVAQNPRSLTGQFLAPLLLD